MNIIVAIMAQGTTRAGLPQLVTIEAIAEASAVCGDLGFVAADIAGTDAC